MRFAKALFAISLLGLTSTPALAGCESSQIDGTFNGLTGQTIMRLTNGQIWQQATYSYNYMYAYMPDVIVCNTLNGTEMHVAGMHGFFLVTLLN